MKCVMIVDGSLPRGFIANTTAALGISLASIEDGLVGKKVKDKSGRLHEGVTNIPIPILTLDNVKMKELYNRLQEHGDEDIRMIGFNNIAQRFLHYDDYEMKLLSTTKDDIEYLGLCLYGSKKKINKITGNLKMLR